MNEKPTPHSLDDALRQLHEPVLAEPVPDRFLPAVDQFASAHALHLQQRRWWSMAGVAASVCMAFGLGWLAHGLTPALNQRMAGASSANRFAQAATVAHSVYSPEVRHPVEVTAEQQEHLVQWLSKRLKHPVKVPNLQAEGFSLMGGRLLPGDSGTRAQFMFQNLAGERVTLYIGEVNDRHDAELAFRYYGDGVAPSFYWVENGFGYALSGRLERPALLKLANLVYKQL
jgi:anti-sigma factor RsiW